MTVESLHEIAKNGAQNWIQEITNEVVDAELEMREKIGKA
jgi:hypothetical protein